MSIGLDFKSEWSVPEYHALHRLFIRCKVILILHDSFKNHSPFFAHWVAQFKWANERIFIRPEDVYFSQTNLYNSLPLDEAVKACRNMYTYELAKVTIQISDPVVMTVEKRVSSTFAEHLGVVGMLES